MWLYGFYECGAGECGAGFSWVEFCHRVDPSALQATNLKATLLSPPFGASLLFFPSLVIEHRPGDLPSPRFGWCVGCREPSPVFQQSFPTRSSPTNCIHMFLWPVKFVLSPILCGLDWQCDVWRNGSISDM